MDEYIPFHFHPFSAFDVAVKSTYYEEEFIYICIRRELARSKRFKILPKHPLSVAECVLFEYDEGFSKIDWDTMQAIGVNDEYAKNVKMAECLTDLVIPVNWVHAIYVKSKDTVLLIKDKLDEYGIRFPPPYVETQIWF